MFREGLRPPDPFGRRDPLRDLRTQDGMSLAALSQLGPVLAVCLGGAGRRMLKDLAARREGIERAGLRLVLVFAEEPEWPEPLRWVARIGDPDHALHARLGFTGTAGLLGRRRESGAAALRDGEVVARESGDRPDYGALARKGTVT